MDALTGMLTLARVQGSLFCRAELTEPWAVRADQQSSALFHVIVRGSGWVAVEGEQPVPYRGGDLVLLPHGDPHVMTGTPDAHPIDIATLPREGGDDGLPCLRHGGEGATTSILCGTFDLAPEGREALLEPLPSLLHVRTGDGPTATWLDGTLRLLADEIATERPGGPLLLSRLADVLLIQVLRAWIEQEQPRFPGWPAGLTDPAVARALDSLHRAPERAWTADELARTAGMSRSVFYERFSQVLGETPSAYLARWRMALARDALRSGATHAEVAAQVGYGSEAAFSRAFKRTVGQTPSAWREAAAVAGD